MEKLPESERRRWIDVDGVKIRKTDAMLDAEKRLGGECVRAYMVRRLAEGLPKTQLANELGTSTPTIHSYILRLRISDLEIAQAKVESAASG